MSGLFLSYSRADRALADQLIRSLRAVGVAVWWDEDMRGVDWQHELEHRISELSGVLVLWSHHSIESNPVRDEARLALSTEKLVNVLADVPKPPFPFDRINGLPLEGWNGRDPHRGWTRLVETVEELVVSTGGANAGDITVALSLREQEIQRRKNAIAAAEEALGAAESRLAEAGDTVKAAHGGLEQVEKQLQQVAELRVTPMILKAAQQEFEAAREVRDQAELQRRSAKTGVDDAKRALSEAKEALDSLFTAVVPAPMLPVRRGPVAWSRPPPPVVDEPPPEAVAAPAPVKAARPRKPKAAPAPEPAPAPQPAIAAASADGAAVMAEPLAQVRLPAGLLSTSPMLLWGGMAAAAVVVLAVSGALLLHKSPAASPGGAATVALASVTATSSPAAALAGKWAPQGFSCDDPMILAVSGAALSVTSEGKTFSEAILPGASASKVTVKADDGDYTYSLRKNHTLSMAGPSGAAMKLTRCAG